MGLCGSKHLLLDGEVIVAAAVVRGTFKSGPLSDSGSDIKSAGGKAGSVTTASLPGSANEPIMLLDTREFEVEKMREGAVKALGVVDTPIDDPRFNSITKLMASIFQTPVALITLITEDRVWFKSKVGPFGACVSREGSWCNYISVPNAPEVLITEDASEDARFSANPYVAGAPHIKFYAGAPLVGRNGMRYGTLCVVDFKRRSFSAEMYALLSNFASLVVQELERDTASLKEVQDDAAAVAAGQQRIEQMVSSAMSAVALVDVRSRAWPVLYANNSFAREEGGDSLEQLTAARGFWDLFEPAQAGKKGEEAMAAVDAAIAAERAIRTEVVSKLTGRAVTVVLRPASSDQLKPTQAIGIPNWVPSEKAPQVGCHAGALPGGLDAGGDAFEGPQPSAEGAPSPQLASCFWFVEVEGSAPATPAPASGGSRAASTPGAPGTPTGADAGAGRRPSLLQTFFSQPLPPALEGLEMGPLVGSGSFGRVYRGMWRDGVVAVKVIDCNHTSQSGAQDAVSTALKEAEMSKALDHPCVVKTYEYAMLPGSNQAAPGGTLWMVQQMCNHGTLIEAVDRGWMRKKRSLVAPPDLRAVLRTLREVAQGMAFLHSNDILHCDLTGNNVLLEAVDGAVDDRGFRARVSDFGLARVAAGTVTTATFGTCSHMAPELMADGLLTKACDVWSFGVLCWEMYSGVRAYVGLRMPHIVFLVTSGKGTLKLPEGAPAGFTAMMESCFNTDHTSRPSFAELVGAIDGLLASGEDATVAPPPPPHHSAGCKGSGELAAVAAAMSSSSAPQSVATPVQ